MIKCPEVWSSSFKRSLNADSGFGSHIFNVFNSFSHFYSPKSDVFRPERNLPDLELQVFSLVLIGPFQDQVLIEREESP